MKNKFFLLIFFLFFDFGLSGQFSIRLSGARGDNVPPYIFSKTDYYIYNFDFGAKYAINQYLGIILDIDYLKYSFYTKAEVTSEILTGETFMKNLSLKGGFMLNAYGFFIKPGGIIGVSNLKTKWYHRYINVKDNIDFKNEFYDHFHDILATGLSLRLGYSYTIKKTISVGVFWEKIKYFGEKRILSYREGTYTPFTNFAPTAYSPDNIIVNPNCYLWGMLLEYNFPISKK